MSAIKMCETCIYQDGRGEFSKCKRSWRFCSTELQGSCGRNFALWASKEAEEVGGEPASPVTRTRSLRQWFYDTFWRIDPPEPPVPRVPSRKFDF